MFSSTAYEAFYTYIGIYLHEASIKIITSQEVLVGLLILILGITFLSSSWKYFSRYMPFVKKGGASFELFFLPPVPIPKLPRLLQLINFRRNPTPLLPLCRVDRALYRSGSSIS